ncbi:MAG: hypothetical protein MZU91_14390 [Desulfosudis oleivorans]|nr:hypothetical protein [Desulfosudis oleivorans]
MPRRPTKEECHGKGELEKDLDREDAEEDPRQEGQEQAAQEEEVGSRLPFPRPMGIIANIGRSRILRSRLIDEESWTDILAQHPIFDRLTPGSAGACGSSPPSSSTRSTSRPSGGSSLTISGGR